MTPISWSESLAGKRHFSSSRPALDLSMAVSPRLQRVPRTSRLCIGQSLPSSCARAADARLKMVAKPTPSRLLFNVRTMQLLPMTRQERQEYVDQFGKDPGTTH